MKTQISAGFTLIEICMVMLIVGLLMSAQFSYYRIQMEKERMKSTNDALAVLQLSLNNYHDRHARFPCPATPSQDPNAPDFEREADCDMSEASRLVQTLHGPHGDAVIGHVPVRSLGLPDRYARDGWGSNILYAVDLGHASKKESRLLGNNNGDQSVMDIVDATGRSVTDFPVEYLLVSPGANRMGGLSADGRFSSCLDGSVEEENCDGDAVFVRDRYSEASGPHYNDDFLVHNRDLGVNAEGMVKEDLDRILGCQRRSAFYAPNSDIADSSGCVAASVPKGACSNGQVVGGISSSGQVLCTPNMQSGLCQGGQVLLGYDEHGKSICTDILMKLLACAQSGKIYAGEGISGADPQGCVMAATTAP